VSAEVTTVPIGYLKQDVKRFIPLSRLNVEPEDVGIAGAEIALKDNNTTGKFTKQQFTLEVERVPVGGDAVPVLEKMIESGHHFILVDAPAETLLRLSDAAKGKDALLFNIRATDERLRQEDCRANVLHTAPDRAMLADALAQYLVWKKWTRWLVAKGVFPEDVEYLEAVRRAAKRFGGTIVEEREYKETPGARRSDTGQLQIQRQMPVFTQGVPSYDVLVVADEKEVFGPYLPYRIWDPRPVAGTAGLRAMSWHPAHEQWGATQMQNRFQRAAKRFMLPLDYQAWVAVRAVGEGASRVGSGDLAKVNGFIRSDALDLAAFKGQKVSFRRWDGQLRQPIIIADPEMPVSVSPQEGFLHERTELDTLGIDEPETKCKLQ
jgi:ABC transporter substrate binding protein (PQQ-dependent alcohol dehydrogenase system)